LRVATRLAAELSAFLELDGEPWTVDLAEHAGRLFDRDDEELERMLARVAGSRVLVVASPTFKATYTGLLKSFFDRYGNNALSGVVAVPLMVGAAPVHALAPEVHLRPLLVELGASVPTRGLYVMESQLPSLDDVVHGWIAEGGPRIRRSLSDVPRGA
jgi:FMN reductase